MIRVESAYGNSGKIKSNIKGKKNGKKNENAEKHEGFATPLKYFALQIAQKIRFLH